jgi:RecA-family ATPase
MTTSFAVTIFEDVAATTKRELSVSLDSLAELVRSTSAPAKDRLPWLKLGRFGPLPNPKSDSGSLRWNGNVLRLSGAVADYDGEIITLGEAGERLDKAGVAGLVYSSPSHMRNGHGPRWRVVCPFSAELPPDDHYHMIARLNGLFGGELATESFTLGQCYYFGSVGNNPAVEVIVSEGATALDLCDELDLSAVGKPNGHAKADAAGRDPQAPLDDIRAALELIPNPVPSWGPQGSWVEWNNVGMAIWRASGGSEEGFAEFDRWSQKSPKYDAEETEFRWRHFATSPPDHIGFGSLVHWCREVEPGWLPPSKRPKEEKTAPPWTITRPSEWVGRDLGEREFIMDEWIPLGEYVALYGVKGVRKTDFVLQLLMATSVGEYFCGIKLRHCITYALFCEDSAADLVRRMDRIAAFYGRDLGDFTGFYWASLVDVFDTEFMNFDTGHARQTAVFESFEKEIAATRAEFAAIDTVADFYGGNEVDRRQVSQFLRLIRGCCFRQNCTVLGLRHPSQRGKKEGTFDSGSTAWAGKERARLVLRDPVFDLDEDEAKERHKFRPPSDKRILTRADCNYAEPGVELDLLFENGGFSATHLARATPQPGQIRNVAADAKFIELLRKMRTQGRWVHDAPTHPSRYAPTVFARDPDRADFTQPEFKRAMDRGFETGRIRLNRVGPGHRSEIVECQ